MNMFPDLLLSEQQQRLKQILGQTLQYHYNRASVEQLAAGYAQPYPNLVQAQEYMAAQAQGNQLTQMFGTRSFPISMEGSNSMAGMELASPSLGMQKGHCHTQRSLASMMGVPCLPVASLNQFQIASNDPFASLSSNLPLLHAPSDQPPMPISTSVQDLAALSEGIVPASFSSTKENAGSISDTARSNPAISSQSDHNDPTGDIEKDKPQSKSYRTRSQAHSETKHEIEAIQVEQPPESKPDVKKVRSIDGSVKWGVKNAARCDKSKKAQAKVRIDKEKKRYKERRRERNRESARQSRARKRQRILELEASTSLLKHENELLRNNMGHILSAMKDIASKAGNVASIRQIADRELSNVTLIMESLSSASIQTSEVDDSSDSEDEDDDDDEITQNDTRTGAHGAAATRAAATRE